MRMYTSGTMLQIINLPGQHIMGSDPTTLTGPFHPQNLKNSTNALAENFPPHRSPGKLRRQRSSTPDIGLTTPIWSVGHGRGKMPCDVYLILWSRKFGEARLVFHRAALPFLYVSHLFGGERRCHRTWILPYPLSRRQRSFDDQPYHGFVVAGV